LNSFCSIDLTAETPRAPREANQKQLQPQRRKGAEGRKEKQKNQKFFVAFLCAFAPSRLSLSSAFPLRPCASAVIVFVFAFPWRLGG
jgi:hypothetical protein